MRIALVGDRPPPFGGIAVHVESLASALEALGHEVAVLDTARVRSYPQFAAALASLAARGYLLHAHTAGHNHKSWLLAAAVGLARGWNRRNVITLHSGLVPGYLAEMPQRQFAARRALAPYGTIVGVSGAVLGALEAAGIERSRMVELPAFSSAAVRPGALPEKVRDLRKRHRVLLSAALSPSPIYGARVLGAALGLLRRSCPDLGCVVFGPGTTEMGEELRGAQLDGCVHGLGEISHAEALAVLQASDAFLRPTLTDGDALTVREALALNTRVVASDAVARPQGVRTFRSGDPFSLAEAVEAALAGPVPQVGAVDAVPDLISIYLEQVGSGARAA